MLVDGAGGLLSERELPADATAALEEFDDLLQTEGDDEADADGDEVDEHGDMVLGGDYFVSGSSKDVWSMVIILTSALVSPLAMPSS